MGTPCFFNSASSFAQYYEHNRFADWVSADLCVWMTFPKPRCDGLVGMARQMHPLCCGVGADYGLLRGGETRRPFERGLLSNTSVM